MPAQVRFHRPAAKELSRAFRRYAQGSQQLADDFRDEVNRIVREIAADPERWSVYPPHFRWARTRRFAFILYFLIEDDGDVQVMAVAHARRRPGYRLRRKP